jgi:arabinogalactan oligomer/maltooligosaccharide transport system permease protein
VQFLQAGMNILFFLIALAGIHGLIFLIFSSWLPKDKVVVLHFLLPAIIGLAVLVLYPLLFSLRLSMSNMSLYHFWDPEISIGQGIDNLIGIFTRPVLRTEYFFPVLFRTVLWTVSQVSAHLFFGIGIALILNTRIPGHLFFKAIFILPWAIPRLISVLVWRTEFHYEFGIINKILKNAVHPDAVVHWFLYPLPNMAAIHLTNLWLGIPFMMLISLGGLQSINPQLYEAADIDGAGPVTKLFRITLPLIKPVLTPAILFGIIGTFSSFEVPYLINVNNLEVNDLMATALFRSAFFFNRYGFSAMFGWVVSLVLFLFILGYIRLAGIGKEVVKI